VVGKVEIDRSSRRIDQFMSGKQSTPSVDGNVVRKVVTTCRTGETAVATEAKIVSLSQWLLSALGTRGFSRSAQLTRM